MNILQINALIVEDELLVSLLEQKILTSLGYRVLVKVSDGESAVRQAKKTSPDIILMDICLNSEMNGIEAAKRIWKYSAVPIVFVSGSQNLYSKAYPLLKSHHSFISKPFSKHSLSLTLHKLLLGTDVRIFQALIHYT